MTKDKQRKREQAMKAVDLLEQRLWNGLANTYGPFNITPDEIAEASMESKHMLYYNPESLLTARADYLSLSDTTKHVLSCLVAGEGFEAVGFSCTGKGRQRKSYVKAAKNYVKNVAKTVCTARVLNEAKGFIESLDSEQLDNIQQIIV